MSADTSTYGGALSELSISLIFAWIDDWQDLITCTLICRTWKVIASRPVGWKGCLDSMQLHLGSLNLGDIRRGCIGRLAMLRSKLDNLGINGITNLNLFNPLFMAASSSHISRGAVILDSMQHLCIFCCASPMIEDISGNCCKVTCMSNDCGANLNFALMPCQLGHCVSHHIGGRGKVELVMPDFDLKCRNCHKVICNLCKQSGYGWDDQSTNPCLCRVCAPRCHDCLSFYPQRSPDIFFCGRCYQYSCIHCCGSIALTCLYCEDVNFIDDDGFEDMGLPEWDMEDSDSDLEDDEDEVHSTLSSLLHENHHLSDFVSFRHSDEEQEEDSQFSDITANMGLNLNLLKGYEQDRMEENITNNPHTHFHIIPFAQPQITQPNPAYMTTNQVTNNLILLMPPRASQPHSTLKDRNDNFIGKCDINMTNSDRNTNNNNNNNEIPVVVFQRSQAQELIANGWTEVSTRVILPTENVTYLVNRKDVQDQQQDMLDNDCSYSDRQESLPR